jgi:hypothetical protein
MGKRDRLGSSDLAELSQENNGNGHRTLSFPRDRAVWSSSLVVVSEDADDGEREGPPNSLGTQAAMDQ